MTDPGQTLVPYGRHRGKPISVVGETDRGIRYLDRLRSGLGLHDPLRRAITDWLNDPLRGNRVIQAFKRTSPDMPKQHGFEDYQAPHIARRGRGGDHPQTTPPGVG